MVLSIPQVHASADDPSSSCSIPSMAVPERRCRVKQPRNFARSKVLSALIATCYQPRQLCTAPERRTRHTGWRHLTLQGPEV